MKNQVKHFLSSCEKVKQETQLKVKKAEEQETETVIKLGKINFRKICIIGDYLAENLNDLQW